MIELAKADRHVPRVGFGRDTESQVSLTSGVQGVTLWSPKGGARRQMQSPEHISLGIDQYLRRFYVGGELWPDS